VLPSPTAVTVYSHLHRVGGTIPGWDLTAESSLFSPLNIRIFLENVNTEVMEREPPAHEFVSICVCERCHRSPLEDVLLYDPGCSPVALQMFGFLVNLSLTTKLFQMLVLPNANNPSGWNPIPVRTPDGCTIQTLMYATAATRHADPLRSLVKRFRRPPELLPLPVLFGRRGFLFRCRPG
jgi:hypothetical protein